MTATPFRSRVVPANEYRRARWKNGAGWTREICACRGDGESGLAAGDWDWRLSIAEIESDAPFSTFPGIDRHLVLLAGHGLRLRFADGEARELHPPHEALRFAGEREVHGELLDGRTEDFNLMWRRDAVRATLWHRPLVGTMVVFVEPATTWALYLVAGEIRFDGDTGLPPMATGDTALLRAGPDRVRYAFEGTGEALLVRIEPLVGAAG